MSNAPKNTKMAQTWMERSGFKDPQLKTQTHDEIMLWLDNYVRTKFVKEQSILLKEQKEKQLLNAIILFDKVIKGFLVYCQKRIEDTQQYRKQAIERGSSPDWCDEEINKWGKEKSRIQQEETVDLTSNIWRDVSFGKTFSDIEDLRDDIRGALSQPYKLQSLINYIKNDCKGVLPIEKLQWEYPIQDGKYSLGFIDMKVEIERIDEIFYFEVKSDITSLGEIVREMQFYRSKVGVVRAFDKHRVEKYRNGIFYVVAPPNETAKQVLASQDIQYIDYVPGIVLPPPDEIEKQWVKVE